MRPSRIRELRKPEYEIIAADKWDRSAFEDQLERITEVGALLEAGNDKLITFWGILQDLFTIFFAGKATLVERKACRLPINSMVLTMILRMDETKSLQGHTVHKRVASVDAIVRLGQAILEAIPDLSAKAANKAAKGEQREEEKDQDADGDGKGQDQEGEEADGGAESEDGGEGEDDLDSEGQGEDDSGPEGQGGGRDDEEEEDSGSEGGGDSPQADNEGSGAGGGGEGAPEGDPDTDDEDRRQGGSGPGGQSGEGADGEPDEGDAEGDNRDDGEAADRSSDRGGSPKDRRGGGSDRPDPEALLEGIRQGLQQQARAIQAAIARAAEEAQGRAEDMAQVGALIGKDLSEAPLDKNGNPDDAYTICRALANNKKLLDIVHTWGNRLRTLMESAQEQKPVGEGFVDTDRGVGDDIELIPNDELYLLAPELAVLTALDVADGTLPQEEHQEEFKREAGNILMLMDVSGSTAGGVDLFIVGIALAISDLTRRQGRQFKVLPFNERALDLIDLSNPDVQDLMEFAAIRASGGTSFEDALTEATKILVKEDPEYPPDVVMITDGVDSVSEEKRAQLSVQLAQLGTKLHVMYIGVGGPESTASLDGCPPPGHPCPSMWSMTHDLGGGEFFLRDLYDNATMTSLFEKL